MSEFEIFDAARNIPEPSMSLAQMKRVSECWT